MPCLRHSHKANGASSGTTQQSSVQVTTEPADTPRKTKKHTRSYSKCSHKVETYQVVYLLQLWAQDVYQLPPDSCVGRPAVSCVSDRPLLLLIVSISVPAEEWHCYGQTQAIDLWLVPDWPGATEGKGMGEETGWSLHGAPSFWHPEEQLVLTVVRKSSLLRFGALIYYQINMTN